MKTLMYVSLLFIKMSFLPNTGLLTWMFVAIGIDFLTGFAKAVLLKKARTSGAMRRTITKFLQYGGALAVSVVLGQAAGQHNMLDAVKLLNFFGDALVVFIIYIEVTSVFENLIEAGPDTAIAKFFFVPVHRVLTVQIKRNPAVQAAEALDKPTV